MDEVCDSLSARCTIPFMNYVHLDGMAARSAGKCQVVLDPIVLEQLLLTKAVLDPDFQNLKLNPEQLLLAEQLGSRTTIPVIEVRTIFSCRIRNTDAIPISVLF